MRLSEFKEEKAFEVVAALLDPIGKITQNKENAAFRENGKTLMDFVKAMLKNNAPEVKEILVILDGKTPDTYHCSAATVLRDMFNMLSDPEIMGLFGFQRQNPASSGSALATTEAPGK